MREKHSRSLIVEHVWVSAIHPVVFSSLLQTFPQVDLQAKWSLYHARMSFHRQELGMSWPSETRAIVVDGWLCWVRYCHWNGFVCRQQSFVSKVVHCLGFAEIQLTERWPDVRTSAASK